jgi:hypothetical protein
MSEYGKIETLYERDEKTHKLIEPLVLKNRVYGLLKSWIFTEKLNGTNIRVMWDGRVRFGGRTDAAQIPADLVAHLMLTFTPDKMRAAFPDIKAPEEGVGSTITPVVLYGEGIGAGLQGGGFYSPSKIFVLFDCLIDGKWFLSQENVEDVASKLGIMTAPLFGEMTLEEATELVRVGFDTRLPGAQPGLAEGLIGRPCEALFDKKGHRLIIKLKTKDFATREAPVLVK